MADEALDEADLDAVLDNDNNDDDYQPDQEVKWIYHEKYIPFSFVTKLCKLQLVIFTWILGKLEVCFKGKLSLKMDIIHEYLDLNDITILGNW